jgi:hypothetical protein
MCGNEPPYLTHLKWMDRELNFLQQSFMHVFVYLRELTQFYSFIALNGRLIVNDKEGSGHGTF